MMTTVLAPTEGRLLISGHDVATDKLRVRQSFGIVFQDASLDEELSAAENMELHGVLYRVPRDERRARTEALLRYVGLWGRRAESVKRFYGGMKRRLEIARALLHQPRVLILDEPTLGLDPQTRNQIWVLVHELMVDWGCIGVADAAPRKRDEHVFQRTTTELFAELVDGALRHDPAVVDDRDTIGDPLGLLHVVGREEDRDLFAPAMRTMRQVWVDRR